MNCIPLSNPIPYAFVSGSLRRCGQRSPAQCCNVRVNPTEAIRRSSRQDCVLKLALQQSFTSVLCVQGHAMSLPSSQRPCGGARCVHVQEYGEAQSDIGPPPRDIQFTYPLTPSLPSRFCSACALPNLRRRLHGGPCGAKECGKGCNMHTKAKPAKQLLNDFLCWMMQ